MHIETRLQSLAWDKSGGDLLTAQTVAGIKGGVSLDQALAWNVGTCTPMPRENSKWKTHEDESTDAGSQGRISPYER
jgi:hypothetical protein